MANKPNDLPMQSNLAHANPSFDDSSQTLKRIGPALPTLGRARATPRDLIDAEYYGEWQNENKE